jgi:two-component system, NarL family, response regulator
MSSGNPIAILVVEDHPVVRNGLKSMIEDEPDLKVVAEAETAEQGLDLFRRLKPEVTLVDLRLPGMNGVELIRTLSREFPDSRFIVLTTFDTDEYIFQAIQAGARAFLLKDAFREEIVRAIRTVHAGKRLLPPEIAERLAGRFSQPTLSPREVEVLQLVAKGESNKSIAAALGVTEGTVKTHVTNIFAKLDVSDRTAATTVALQRGIIRI